MGGVGTDPVEGVCGVLGMASELSKQAPQIGADLGAVQEKMRYGACRQSAEVMRKLLVAMDTLLYPAAIHPTIQREHR